MQGEPCGCAGGVGTDAVHDCEMFVSGMRKKTTKCNLIERMIRFSVRATLKIYVSSEVAILDGYLQSNAALRLSICTQKIDNAAACILARFPRCVNYLFARTASNTLSKALRLEVCAMQIISIEPCI